MKTITKYNIIIFIILGSLFIYGQEEENALNYNQELRYSVAKYSKGEVTSDYNTTFSTTDNKEDFKKLRIYLLEKNQLKKTLYDTHANNEYEVRKKSDYKTKIQNLERRIRDKADTIIIKGVYIYELGYDSYEMDITPKIIREDIIPELNKLILDLGAITQENQQLMRNIDIVKFDITSCENQIDMALAPAYQKQAFRRAVSTWFTGLIALLLLGFFTIIYFKSDNTIGRDFLGDNGLQFITLFVLIIAIILFGILGILEATELAAILSGISGYILGRGASQGNNRIRDTKKTI